MKGLLIKDLTVIGKQKKFLVIVLLLAVFLTLGSEDTGFAGNYAMLVLTTLTLTTISYDEMNGGMMFLLSLPATRKTYVKAKYTFAFLNLLVAAAVGLALSVVESVFKKVAFNFDDNFSAIMGMMLVMGLMLSVAIPLEFKFGAEKGRMIVAGAMVGVLFVGIAGYKVLRDVFGIDLLSCLNKLFSGIESEALISCIIVGGLFALLVLIMFCSYLIASNVMRKKEF